MIRLSPRRLAEIQQRAAIAQNGRWPDDAQGLARLMLRSSKTRTFVTYARRDILELATEVRTLLQAADELEAERDLLRGAIERHYRQRGDPVGGPDNRALWQAAGYDA